MLAKFLLIVTSAELLFDGRVVERKAGLSKRREGREVSTHVVQTILKETTPCLLSSGLASEPTGWGLQPGVLEDVGRCSVH